MLGMKPILLGIETSTNACSVALSIDNRIIHRFEIIPQMHTKRLFPMIREVMNEANITLDQLDAIAVGRGPGSFTGIRIAVSAAQGLAFGLGINVYPISTLAALAHQIQDDKVIPTLDARMGDVYVRINNEDKLMPLAEVTFPRHAEDIYPRAYEIVQLALLEWEKGNKGVAPEEALPVYLRDEVAKPSSKKISLPILL